jgi:quercetin dioxygenase-like cupin family protein
VPRGLTWSLAEAGQVIEGFGGMRLRLVEVGDELLEMEASYTGEAGMPPEHLHPRQAERFEILDGAMRAIVDGEERVYEAGDSFEVPAGTPHQMAAEGPTRMRWEVRPALRTAEFFKRLYGSGPGSAQEMGEVFLAEFEHEFRLTTSNS